MIDISVNTAKKYIVSVDDTAKELGANFLPYIAGQKIAVITDENIAKIYPNFFDKIFPDKEIFEYIVKVGESSKSPETALQILNFLAKNNFSRRDSVVAFGGGVVGDLTGFVASIYMRGINYFNVPTTLLAMVDAAVGGKTAINIDYGKNLCGTFYQPCGVFVNVDFLKTLPKNDILCGIGEILKYCYINYGKDILTLEDVSTIPTEEVIAQCIKIKAMIVEQDEKEQNIRKILNFGHTIGHAIERLSEFELPHGICVAKGIIYSLTASVMYGGLDKSFLHNYIIKARELGFDLHCPYDKKAILEMIKFDKKASDNVLDFVIMNNKQEMIIKKLSFDEVEAVIDACNY